MLKKVPPVVIACETVLSPLRQDAPVTPQVRRECPHGLEERPSLGLGLGRPVQGSGERGTATGYFHIC